MISLALAILAGTPVEGATSKHLGLNIGKRLIAAIKGRGVFEDGDFVRPLADGEKSALRQFSRCSIKEPMHGLVAVPNQPMTFVSNYNDINIIMRCKGVPSSMPVGITLHLQNGKVAKVETHNADLMRPQ